MRLIDNYREWRRFRRAVNQMNQLSDRELNDVGIARADIRRAVRAT